MTDFAALHAATHDLDGPFAVVDLDAFEANADDLVRRAAGVPIRVASKSVRCRALLRSALRRDGFQGVMAYSLREAIWLVRNGVKDVLVAYPSVDRHAWQELGGDETLIHEICVMVDSTEHLELIARYVPRPEDDLCLVIDIDCSLRIGPAHLGVRRSPLRTPDEARALAVEIGRRQGMRMVGLMFYDAQVAGMPDASPAVRWMKKRSHADLGKRRREVVTAVREVADVQIVNGGGTGSLHSTGTDLCLTELAAGSGLYGPTLFDGYDDFSPQHAMFYALPVVRRPAPGIVTAYSGGYIASGAVGASRAPSPVWPEGLSLIGTEGAGEVQTPLKGDAADALRIGDVVWMRYAKAGEMLERFDTVHLVRGDRVVETVPTYRGEGRNFG